MLNVDMSYCVFQQARNSDQIMEHERVQVFSIRMHVFGIWILHWRASWVYNVASLFSSIDLPLMPPISGNFKYNWQRVLQLFHILLHFWDFLTYREKCELSAILDYLWYWDTEDFFSVTVKTMTKVVRLEWTRNSFLVQTAHLFKAFHSTFDCYLLYYKYF